MTTQAPHPGSTGLSDPVLDAPRTGHGTVALLDAARDLVVLEPLDVAAVAEGAEAVIEDLDAPRSAAAALIDGLDVLSSTTRPAMMNTSAEATRLLVVAASRRPAQLAQVEGATSASDDPARSRVISVDEYAKAVLYNGLGHYRAARAAAQRACERDDFELYEWALAELVEASTRSGDHGVAVAAVRRLEDRARLRGSDWALGIAACCRALVTDGDDAERHYLEAIARLGATPARVAPGRARLLYGEWLRRRGRRVDARHQLRIARRTFVEVGMAGFTDRADRELHATGETVRKRSDDTRSDLTPQEAQIARLASAGCTNPEIGAQLFISPRTVEWHLRKVFTKLGLSSRRDLREALPDAAPPVAWA